MDELTRGLRRDDVRCLHDIVEFIKAARTMRRLGAVETQVCVVLDDISVTVRV